MATARADKANPRVQTRLADLLSVSEVARLKGVTRQAVTRAIREARLPAVQVADVFAVRRRQAVEWEPNGNRSGSPDESV